MNWPLMKDNISREDVEEVGRFLSLGEEYPWPREFEVPRLTQGDNVHAFEYEFAGWLGCRYGVMVNSGSSANLITMAALKQRSADNHEIIVPTITWSSDIMSVLHAGFKPVFVDIDPTTLGMDWNQVYEKIGKYTKAVFVTHTLGFNAMPSDAPAKLRAVHVELIEDCCEATGAWMCERPLQDPLGKRLGAFGLASNFSFYYAHHMSTIEGGMVCTDSAALYDLLRRLRSHGLVREMMNEDAREEWHEDNQDLDPQFIFAEPAYNVRSTEINAVIGRSQLKRIHKTIEARSMNLQRWLSAIDGDRYVNNYYTTGSSNYAMPLVLREPNHDLMLKVLACLKENGVEYRRGTAGGGNQLRQPYLRRYFHREYEKYPQAEHVHFYGLYIGNYPGLDHEQIHELCQKLNAL